MYIGDWLERGERYWPDNVAVVDVAKGEAGRFTYRQLNRRANQLANWLRNAIGVQRGDRVGMLALNGVEFLDAFFACGKLGAIFVPYNWRSHWRELVELIEVTQPKVLIYSDDFKANVGEIEQATRKTQYAVRSYLYLDGSGISGSLPYEATLQSTADTPVTNEPVNAEDIICLIFTGGTTGLPKGAQISYRMIGWNTLNTVIHELQRGDITITHTPLFHTGGLLVYTLPLLTLGGTVVIMRKWTPDDMLDLIEREQITMFFCVPSQYQMMLQAPKFATTSFKSVRFMTSGGAPLPVPIIKAYRDQHGVVFKQGFGMTEFGPGIFSMGPEFAEKKAGSIGQPNYFVDARVVDDNNQPVPVNTIGELVLNGPSMCSGYFNNPEASQSCHRCRRLVPHRRSGPYRCRRLLFHRRSQEGHVHQRRRECLSRRDREGVVRASGRGAVRGHRCARREVGRSRQGDCRLEAECLRRRRRVDRAYEVTSRQVQGA